MNWYKTSKNDSYEYHMNNLINIIKSNDWNNVRGYINKLIGEGYKNNSIQLLINRAIDLMKERENELV